MSKEKPTVIEVTAEECLERIQAILAPLPYETPGQLRAAVFDSGPLCCYGCHNYYHPHAEAWQELEGWLYLAGKDWRTVE